jgi:hypothetical protein
VGCRSLECVLEGAFFWKELACSGQWCCFSWFRIACRSRRPVGREDGRLRKTGAAGQRREEARGRTGKKTKRGLQENRPRPDFRKSLHHDSALHLSMLWRKSGACETPEIPSFSSKCLRLPMAQSVLFALVSKTTPTALPSFIPLSLKLYSTC